jgi:N-acyl-L-homoserine lactone synthetase
MTPSNAGSRVAGDILASEEAKAARIDAAAEHMLRRLKPVQFRLARTRAEREAAYRLRYRTVTERGWQPPVELTNGLECEPLDEGAHHLIGWRDGQAIANCRIICPTPGQPLPLEEFLGIRVQPVGEVAQIDRFCIDRAYSDRRGELLLGVVCATWQSVHRWGYRYITGFFSGSMIRLYQRFGLEALPIGPACFYWGEERYPALVKPIEVGERFFERIYADR